MCQSKRLHKGYYSPTKSPPYLDQFTTTPMNFWTPERCKTISTLILMDNSAEISMQAALSKNPEIAARKTAIVEMIQAELRSRV